MRSRFTHSGINSPLNAAKQPKRDVKATIGRPIAWTRKALAHPRHGAFADGLSAGTCIFEPPGLLEDLHQPPPATIGGGQRPGLGEQDAVADA